MEYRGIEFTVRARPGRDQWTWTIYPKNASASTHQFVGTRDDAIAAACRRIDRRLTDQRTQHVKKSN